ncbi:hypothetical protein F5X68DRAFT_233361 [Plectosphaerella plurivora]|uniref:Uncharacterized protein n=1 Tax=Plectosphaerella plurivora TaxID=936078 RepID=A0A9P8V8C2_9PEZI|nr:hypothetical protein F5X68DRAFT_233361 [Plectosphaerella plurivora]
MVDILQVVSASSQKVALLILLLSFAGVAFPASTELLTWLDGSYCYLCEGVTFEDAYTCKFHTIEARIELEQRCRRDMGIEKGVPCDVVSNIADQYNASSTSSFGNALGSYGQILNLACLRSDCPDIDACVRRRELAGPPPSDCANLEGDFDFENAIFSQVASLSIEEIEATSLEADVLGVIGSLALNRAINPLQRLLLSSSGFTSPETLGTAYAGVSHFINELGPFFAGYISNVVATTPSDTLLRTKLDSLAREHETLFKCAVNPGFKVQVRPGEIPAMPAAVGAATVPVVARTLRQLATYMELLDAGRITSTGELQTKFGIDLPVLVDLAVDVFGWDQPALPAPETRRAIDSRAVGSTVYELPGLQTVLNELSSGTQQSQTIRLALEGSEATLEVVDRHADLEPMVMRSAFLDVTRFSDTGLPQSVLGGEHFTLVSPVAAFHPVGSMFASWNRTHAVTHDINNPLAPLSSYLASPDELPFADIEDVPKETDTSVLFREAIISFTVDPTVVAGLIGRPVDISSEVILLDLASGLPLNFTIMGWRWLLCTRFDWEEWLFKLLGHFDDLIEQHVNNVNIDDNKHRFAAIRVIDRSDNHHIRFSSIFIFSRLLL